MKRALVTGGTGYLGSNLVRGLLDEGWQVNVVLRAGGSTNVKPGAEAVQHDGSCQGLVKLVGEAAPDVVFHLASVANPRYDDASLDRMVGANVVFGVQLLEAMARTGCRHLVNAGTYSAYGKSGAYAPNNLYVATKQALQTFFPFYVNSQRLSVITLVLYDIYGPGDRRGKFLNLLLEHARSGEDLPATPGEQLVDFVHVDDTVRALIEASKQLENWNEAAGHMIYRVDTGRRLRLKETADIIATVSGMKAPVIWGGIPYPSYQTMEPLEHGIARLPNWEAQIMLEEGLKSLVSEAGSPTHDGQAESGVET